MQELSKKLGEMTYDGLISGLNPHVNVGGGVIAKLGAKKTLVRGTILAKNAAGKLIVLGSDVDATGTFSGTGDGSTTKFSLVSGGVVPTSVQEVKVDGTATTAYTYNATLGEVEFETAPANTKSVAVKYTTGGGGAFAILCDDTEVGTSDDVNAAVYIAGCFDPDKCTVASGYTLTDADKDKLRELGIIFKAASAAN